jgi:phosphatidylglycerophosphatase A
MKKIKRRLLFHTVIATGFGSGFSPLAPGTAGALLATGIWAALLFASPQALPVVTLALIAVFTALGVRSSNALEPYWGKDPARIVVDEMVGVWIALMAVDGNGEHALWGAALAFVLFRLFDIFKPLGIRRMERLKGGWGVMMDDIVAGCYSFLLLLFLRWGLDRLGWCGS